MFAYDVQYCTSYVVCKYELMKWDGFRENGLRTFESRRHSRGDHALILETVWTNVRADWLIPIIYAGILKKTTNDKNISDKWENIGRFVSFGLNIVEK